MARKKYHVVPKTGGHARYYRQKLKVKGFKHKLSLPKKLAGTQFRHLYIKK